MPLSSVTAQAWNWAAQGLNPNPMAAKFIQIHPGFLDSVLPSTLDHSLLLPAFRLYVLSFCLLQHVTSQLYSLHGSFPFLLPPLPLLAFPFI